MNISWIYYANEPRVLGSDAMQELRQATDSSNNGDAAYVDGSDVGVLFDNGDGEQTVYYGKSYASLAHDFAALAAKLTAIADRTTTPRKNAPTMNTYTVTNNGRGTIRVHRPGCRDIFEQTAGGGSAWDVTTADLRGIVMDIYPPSDFEGWNDDASNWRDYAGNIDVMPCAGNLPNEA